VSTAVITVNEMSRFALHSELLPYLDGTTLEHPLLRFKYAWPAMFARLNRAFELATRENRVIDLNTTHSDIQNRLARHLQRRPVDSAKYYRDFGNLWTHAELTGLTSDVVAMLIDPSHEYTAEIMTDQERDFLIDLPDEIELFRAHHESLQCGCCWTLDEEFARRWATGIPQNNLISRGMASKRNVIAYISRRSEHEVLMPRQTVEILETVVA